VVTSSISRGTVTLTWRLGSASDTKNPWRYHSLSAGSSDAGGDQAGEHLVLRQQVFLYLHGFVEHRVRVIESSFGTFVSGGGKDVLADDDH
jgi:hypothetical protein